MLLVGLTGGIGSGKSTVSRLLAARGAVVIDADEIARAVVEPGEPAYKKIVDTFGAEVLRPDLSLDRAALAALVFADPSKLQALNEITHPPVMERIADLLETLRGTDEIVILDVPLLIEAGGGGSVDLLVVVDSPGHVRLSRLVIDREMSESEALARMRSQISDEERRERATWVVDNSGSLEHLEAEVEHLWRDLEARRAAP